MSGSDPSKLPANAAAPPPVGGDPSMEDILASIRRILAEEEGEATRAAMPAPPPARPPAPPKRDDGVLQLDASMMLPDPVQAQAPPAPDAEPPEADAEPPEPEIPPAPAMETSVPSDMAAPSPSSALMGDEAAAAATTAVGSLLRTLTAERTTQVHASGPTIEDVVRAELRPMLKEWLDTHLPGLAERLVRAEIERVVSRAVL